MKVAFVGLGVMGFPMAGHLARSGHEVTVFNRSAEKALRWAESHAGEAAQTVAKAARGAEVLALCVGNDDDVRAVVAEALPVLAQGAVIVDHTTTSAKLAREMAELAQASGRWFVDAPVSGGSQGAVNGTLTIMVGGDKEVFEQARPVLEAMGKAENIFYVGPQGAGEIVKLVNNSLVGSIAAAIAESFVMGVKAGVDVEMMAKIIGVSAGASWQLSTQFPLRAFNGSFQPGFMTDLLHKDLGLALELAAENNTSVPITALSRQLYEMARAAGYGREDYTSLLKVLERMAGVEVRN